MEDLLRRLDFADEDARAFLGSRAQPAGLILERHAQLVAGMGRHDRRPNWPFDPAHPWQNVWTFLATIGDVRAHHASIGIPDDVSWASLRDLGRHSRIDRQLHGTPGLRKAWWLMLHFHGQIFELGRLQFELLADGRLSVHIPATGPLDPAACDASFAQARELFGERTATCVSWLLEPALRDVLQPDSNIVRFQERFELVAEGPEADEEVLIFVFGALEADVDALPQETTLQRAAAACLRAGDHWHTPTGRLSL